MYWGSAEPQASPTEHSGHDGNDWIDAGACRSDDAHLPIDDECEACRPSTRAACLVRTGGTSQILTCDDPGPTQPASSCGVVAAEASHWRSWRAMQPFRAWSTEAASRGRHPRLDVGAQLEATGAAACLHEPAPSGHAMQSTVSGNATQSTGCAEDALTIAGCGVTRLNEIRIRGFTNGRGFCWVPRGRLRSRHLHRGRWILR